MSVNGKAGTRSGSRIGARGTRNRLVTVRLTAREFYSLKAGILNQRTTVAKLIRDRIGDMIGTEAPTP